MRTVVARRRLSPAKSLLDPEDFLIEAVVLVAVLCEPLLQAFFRVVGRHNGCDGDEDGSCYDGFDDRHHCCEGEVD